MPPYTINTCTPSDAAGIANANMRSFYQYSYWALLWPGMTIEEIVEGNRLRLPRQLTKGRDIKRHEMAVDSETGEVVGYARWVLLNTDDEFNAKFWLEAQVKEATAEEAELYEKIYKEATDEEGQPLGVNKEMTGGDDTSLEDRCKKITDGKPWLELDHIGTIPTHGRRGVGGLLLESGIKIADAAGIPVFVMAYPHGLGLYQKYGFEVLDEYLKDDTKHGGVGSHLVSFLVRPVGGPVKP